MSWSGVPVLVTGGEGFIGSHLVDRLVTEGADVTVVDCKGDARLTWPNVTKQCVDISYGWGFIRPQRFDVIFHLAANAYVPPSVEKPYNDFRTNCVSTLTLLEELRQSDWRGRLVYASSAAVYGNPVWSPVREDQPTVPVSPYGCGKLAAERYAATFAELYGLNIASARLFSVYGPRQRKQVIYDLIRKLDHAGSADGDRVVPVHGDGTQVRDFVYVTDVVQALTLIAEQAPMRGEVYNVASGSAYSIGEIAGMLRKGMAIPATFLYSGQNRPGDPEKLIVDIGRLAALGYRSQVSIEAGLAATVGWYQQVPGDDCPCGGHGGDGCPRMERVQPASNGWKE